MATQQEDELARRWRTRGSQAAPEQEDDLTRRWKARAPAVREEPAPDGGARVTQRLSQLRAGREEREAERTPGLLSRIGSALMPERTRTMDLGDEPPSGILDVGAAMTREPARPPSGGRPRVAERRERLARERAAIPRAEVAEHIEPQEAPPLTPVGRIREQSARAIASAAATVGGERVAERLAQLRAGREEREAERAKRPTALGVAKDISHRVTEAGVGVAHGVTPGLIHGALTTGEAVTGGAMQILGSMYGIDTLKDAGKRVSAWWDTKIQRNELPEELRGKIAEDPSLMLDPEWLAYSVADMVPGMALTIGTGYGGGKAVQVGGKLLRWTPETVNRLATLAQHLGAGTVGGALEGRQTYKEVLDLTGDEQKAVAAAQMMTAASGTLNALSVGKALSPGAWSSVWRFLTTGATEALTEYAEEPAEAAIKMGVTEGEFTPEMAKEQLVAGLNVLPAAFVSGGLGGAGGAVLAGRQESEPGRPAEAPAPPPAPPGPAAAPAAPPEAPAAPAKGIRRRIAELADPTMRTELEEAYRDKRTGLPNAAAWNRAQPTIDADPALSVVMADVRNLGGLNEVAGSEPEADKTLMPMFQRVAEIAGRFGVDARNVFHATKGDEIAVAAPAEVAPEIAAAIEEEIGKPQIGETEYVTGFRAGVGQTAQEASEAMHRAKLADPEKRWQKGASVAAAAPATPERVTAAAIELRDGRRFEGPTHGDAMVAAQDAPGMLDPQTGQIPEFETGFVTSAGRFVLKDEAARLGAAVGQVPAKLPMGRTGAVAQDFGPEGVPAEPVAEPAPTAPTWRTRAPSRRVEGREQATFFPGDQRTVQTRFAVVEAADLYASNDPQSFERRPEAEYPGGVQGRAYHGERGRQAREEVIMQSEPSRYDVSRALDATVQVTGGVPVVTPSGVVVAGNQRAMMVQRALEHPAVQQKYQEALRGRTAEFGLIPNALEGFKNPVLVRVVADPKLDLTDEATLKALNTASDVTDTKAKDLLSDAATRASQFMAAPRAMDHFMATTGAEQTLREYLDTSAGKGFVNLLLEENVIASTEKADWVNGNGALNTKGVDALERVFQAAAIGNPDALLTAPASALAKLDSSLGAMVQARAVGEEWSLGPAMVDGFRVINSARELGWTIDATLTQSGLFGDIDPFSAAVAKFLEKPVKDVRTALKRYAQWARDSKEQAGTGDLFGAEPTTPQEAQKRIFGVERDAPGAVRERAAEYAREPAFGLPGIWKSRLEAAITAGPGRATGKEWERYLHPAKRGFAEGEAEWTGIRRYLAENAEKKLTKEEVFGFARERGVRLEERTLGGKPSEGDKDILTRMDEMADRYGQPGDSYKDAIARAPAEAQDEYARLLKQYEATIEPQRGPPRFAQYTQPGGENYREVLVRLGEVQGATERQRLLDKHGGMSNLLRKVAQGDSEAIADRAAIQSVAEQKFESSHWPDDPNTLGFLQLKDRTINGEKSLHIEALQSDWHQRARTNAVEAAGGKDAWKKLPESERELRVLAQYRKGGGKSSEEIVGQMRALDEEAARINHSIGPSASPRDFPDAYARLEEIHNARVEAERSLTTPTVPDAPYKKTDEWLGLLVRRALQEASDGDYKRLSWATAKQAGDASAPEKIIKDISYRIGEDGKFDARANLQEGGKWAKEGMTDKEAGLILGEKFVAKMREGVGEVGEDGWRTATGSELNVGHEHLISTYDVALPKIFQKEAKALGLKVDVEPVEIPDAAKVTYDEPVYEGPELTNARIEAAQALMQSGTMTNFAIGVGVMHDGSSYMREWETIRGMDPGDRAVGIVRYLRNATHYTRSNILGALGGKLRETAIRGDTPTNLSIRIMPDLTRAVQMQGLRIYERAQDYSREHNDLVFGGKAEARQAARAVVKIGGDFVDTVDGPLDARARLEVMRGTRDRAWVSLRGHVIKNAEDAHRVITPFFRSKTVEIFHAVLTDADGNVLENLALSSGALDYVVIEPWFQEKIGAEIARTGAVRVWLSHNHPSGDPTPSTEDLLIHERIREYGKLNWRGVEVSGLVTDSNTYSDLDEMVGPGTDYYLPTEAERAAKVQKVPGLPAEPSYVTVTAGEVAADLVRTHLDDGKIGVLYLDGRHNAVALELHPRQALGRVFTEINAGELKYGAGSAIVAVNRGGRDVARALERIANAPVLDVIEVGGATVQSVWDPQRRAAREATPGYLLREGRAPDYQRPAPAVPEAAAEVGDPNIVALRKADIAEIRERLGLEPLEESRRQGLQEAWDAAIAQRLAPIAVEIAQEAVASNRPLTPTEHAGAVQRYIQLERQLTDARALVLEATNAKNEVVARRALQRSLRVLDEIDVLTTATDLTGTAAGRALSVRRLRADADTYTLARGLQEARKNKGSALTPDEVAKIEALTNEVQRLEKEVADLAAANKKLNDEHQAKIAAAVAKAEAEKARSGRKTQGQVTRLRAERADLLKQLSTLGIRLNDVTGVSAEGLEIIGKLAVNSIRLASAEGKVDIALDAVVKEVLADLNNPAISERDVREALAGRSAKRLRKARTDADRLVQDLKTQARLLSKIEAAEKGIFDAKRTKAQQSEAVRALKRQLTALRTLAYRSARTGERLERAVRTINELQDQLDGHYRNLTNKKATPATTEELTALQEKIRSLRQEMRTEDALTDVQEQLRTGEFKIPEKREAPPVTPEMEKKQIALRKARREWRQAVAAMQREGARQVIADATAFLRTMKATADMSATLRQAFWLSARRPVTAARTFAKSFQAFFSAYTSEQINNAIQEHPNQLIRDRAGLELSDVGGLLNEREEYFASNLAERLPIIGIAVRASDRSMTTTLNLIRVAAFDQFLEANPNATTEELRAWADWVNVASGKGNMGRARAIATELSTVFFAPRFAWSRFQTPTRLFKHWKQPRVRNEIAKDYAAVLGVGITALVLASLAGLDVGLDPREADFGKISFGDTHIDIWAGVQQPVRLLARIVLGLTDKWGVTGEGLSDADKRVDPGELLWRFTSFKFAPTITVPMELYRGETAVGEPVTPASTAIRAVLPLVYEGVYDAYQSGGAGTAAVTGAGEFLGLGIQTYAPSETQARRDIRALGADGKSAEALARMREWNAEHPDNPIHAVGDLELPAAAPERTPRAERPPRKQRAPSGRR